MMKGAKLMALARENPGLFFKLIEEDGAESFEEHEQEKPERFISPRLSPFMQQVLAELGDAELEELWAAIHEEDKR